MEGGVAVGEDAAVGGHQPVAVAVRGGRHAHHRSVEHEVAGRAVEDGVAVGEDAAVRCHQPVAAVVAGRRDGDDGLVELEVPRVAEVRGIARVGDVTEFVDLVVADLTGSRQLHRRGRRVRRPLDGQCGRPGSERSGKEVDVDHAGGPRREDDGRDGARAIRCRVDLVVVRPHPGVGHVTARSADRVGGASVVGEGERVGPVVGPERRCAQIQGGGRCSEYGGTDGARHRSPTRADDHESGSRDQQSSQCRGEESLRPTACFHLRPADLRWPVHQVAEW